MAVAIVLLATAVAATSLGELARRDTGDIFTLIDGGECGATLCAEHGARAVTSSTTSHGCACACPQRAPLFREDRELCVDDLPECSLATFGTGVGVQRIPFVYLPLKGQIIHPSREITFQNVKTPICAVSGAQYLTRKGFLDLRNTLDADVPFNLFRDEGRTFLQWSGEDDVRTHMSGRVMVVRLLCRDVDATPISPLDLRGVFTPCVAFRVQGTPPRHNNNVTEVQFAANAQTSEASSSSGLSVTEYVVIGISSLLLGLIYVASVFLYLHIRKRRKLSSEKNSVRKLKGLKKDGTAITERDIVRINNERIQTLPLGQDDGVVKKNPLLNISRQYHDNKLAFPSDSSNVSDSDEFGDSAARCEDNKQTTSAIVHLNNRDPRLQSECSDISHRDESGIERLPDEHVSIVETIEDREIARPVGTTRRKLYFNPAYFEPHLMAEPPPAAIEFLTKIREVISIAKHKMEAKRFHPVLNEIPEEETYPSNGTSLELYSGLGSQRSGSIISLKRENSRKKSVNCVGCPGCKSDSGNDMKNVVRNNIPTCVNCLNTKGDKQNSIRKWLENIPIVKQKTLYNDLSSNINKNNLATSLLSLPTTEERCRLKKQNSFSISNSMYSSDNFPDVPKRPSTRSVRSEPPLRTYNIPLPDFEDTNCEHNHLNQCRNSSRMDCLSFHDCQSNNLRDSYKAHLRRNKILTNKNALPDMVNEAIALEHCSKSENLSSSDEEKFPGKILRDAQNSNDRNNSPGNDYETDSLERASNKKRHSTLSEYPEVSSSQASPSLSNALPLEEELTMQNAVYKTHSSSNSTTPSPRRDFCIDQNHYETIESKKVNTDIVNKEPENISGLEVDAKRNGDYSLVSEVYVNNNFGSAPTSPSGSECSMGSRKFSTIHNNCEEKPGCLTIEVKDPPENYIKIHESDGFEPDTLDRKHPKHKQFVENVQFSRKDLIQTINGNEGKSSQIQLRSSGTFTKTSNKIEYTTKFNSLRHDNEHQNNRPKLSLNLYKEMNKVEDTDDTWDDSEWNPDEGRILTLELRHSKRQRQCTPPTIKQLKNLPRPDVLPPLPPTDDNIYEKPMVPPRKVENERVNQPESQSKDVRGRNVKSRQLTKPVVESDANKNCIPYDSHYGPSCSPVTASIQSQASEYKDTSSINTIQSAATKSVSGRNSTRRHSSRNCRSNIDTNTFIRGKEDGVNKSRYRRKRMNIEDSGYLSSDSTCSRQVQRKLVIAKKINCSDTDDTENEARSESGAESIETHSVYFGSFRKLQSSDENSNNSKTVRDSTRSNRH